VKAKMNLLFKSFIMGPILLSACICAPAVHADITTGLVAWYQFDNDSGSTVLDSSSTGLNGAIIGNPIRVPGMSGQALSFNGFGDFVYVPDNAALHLGKRTVAVWIKAKDLLKTGGTIAGWGHGTCQDSNRVGITSYNGSFGFSFQPVSGQVVRVSSGWCPVNTVKLGEWAHYVFTYDTDSSGNNTFKVYKNGVLIGTNTAYSNGISEACGFRLIGSQEPPSNIRYIRTFSGLMDDFRIYNRVFTQSDVTELYNVLYSAPTDSVSPSTPGSPSATAITSGRINLSWTASTDNVGVAGYIIYKKKGVAGTWYAIDTTTGTTYIDKAHSVTESFDIYASASTLNAATTYYYKVQAFDAAYNVSTQTAEFSATTPAAAAGTYTLTVNRAGTSMGTADSYPSGINCGSTCFYSFSRNTSVHLEAYSWTAGCVGQSFSGWTGTDCFSAGTGQCEVFMDADKTITANYSTIVDGMPPLVTVFSIPATTSSVTVSITSFIASDNVGVTGYKVTESGTAPLATDPGWVVPAPTSYTVSSGGSKTLYAWAKDAAGNVSTSLSASVTITASDTTPPTITAFLIPASSSSLRVSPITITASDNVGVTGYFISESGTTPPADDYRWVASAPTFYDFNSTGSKTLYAWAKDAAGNVSTRSSASVTISVAPTAPAEPANLQVSGLESSCGTP
jgi:hypothetical protein